MFSREFELALECSGSGLKYKLSALNGPKDWI